ncbi:type IV pilin [Natronomonas marina]|jgi:FlaG/FlaF family flagellin (archaellin)|uniref:type IV pilin n=1 Tax=Natronomonas marina TaxID=2961939 RepID=UPI0020C97C4A|nr:type IV pilin [Natronomonas marina]
MSDRAAVPVVGVVLLVALTVVTAAGVGALLSATPPDGTTVAAFDCTAAPDGTVTVTHRGGGAVDPERLRVRISVGGRRLAEQPPVPFFSATGFHSGPTGPFNSAYSGSWTAGETASLRVASTNAPAIRAGASVEIRMYVGDRRIAVLETTA